MVIATASSKSTKHKHLDAGGDGSSHMAGVGLIGFSLSPAASDNCLNELATREKCSKNNRSTGSKGNNKQEQPTAHVRLGWQQQHSRQGQPPLQQLLQH